MTALDELMATGTGVIDTLDDLQGWLSEVAHAVKAATPGCEEVGVTVIAGHLPRTAAFTTTRTLTIDALQYGLDQGPCLEAHRMRTPVVTTLDEGADRWPEFARAAREEHMQAVAAFPLTSGQVSVGALNMYAREPITLDDEERRCLAALASRVGDAVSATYALIDARELVGQLETAMASRATIEQAKGVIMGRHGIDEDAAFELLRIQSQRTNTKVSALAASIVDEARSASGAVHRGRRPGAAGDR